MDVELKGPSNETASKTEEISEATSAKDKPITSKITKASLKTRSRSSDREKERPKSPKEAIAALSKTRSRSGTPQKSKSETKTLTLTLTKLDEKVIENEQLKDETKEVNRKSETTETVVNGEKHVEEAKSKDQPKDVNQTEKPTEPKDKKEERTDKKEGKTDKQEERTDKKEERTDKKEESTDKKEERTDKKEERTDKKEERTDKREASTVEPKLTIKKPSPKKSEESVEMDPLVLIGTDEPDPELQFDDTSDLESGKGSPVISRCKTRRSHTRNIPTPKTPKSDSVATTPEINDQESEQSEKDDGLNESVSVTLDPSDSTDADDLSTKAEVGSDFTRLDYCDQEISIGTDDSSYLNASRERTLSETLRNLSSRRSIRPLGDDYRKRALRNYQERSDLSYSYPTTDSIQSLSGTKRKDRSETPEEVTKKFKSESPGLVSLFASPISNIKTKFSRSDMTSSTPKLTGYKDYNKDIRGNENDYELTNGIVEEKKSWCSVM